MNEPMIEGAKAMAVAAPVVNSVANTSFFAGSAVQRVDIAREISSVLRPIIIDQALFKKIGPSEHVFVEGWSILGSLLGVSARELEVKEIDDGGYMAKVILVRRDNGVQLGDASAICMPKEKRWRGADAYAVRSMAITRATGRAFKKEFGWIMKMTGFHPTPYEEMDADAGSQTIEVSTYTGTDTQKVLLKDSAERARVVGSALLCRIHDAMLQRPMTDLQTVINQVKGEK